MRDGGELVLIKSNVSSIKGLQDHIASVTSGLGRIASQPKVILVVELVLTLILGQIVTRSVLCILIFGFATT